MEARNRWLLVGILFLVNIMPATGAAAAGVKAIVHNMAIRTDGTLWAWGYNQQGDPGVGDTTERHEPTLVRFAVAQPWMLLLLD